jgi:two-component system sensor histidine kinase UhpB
VLNATGLLLVLATLLRWGDPDLVVDALWISLAVGAFVFGLRMTIVRIVVGTFLVLSVPITEAAMIGDAAEFEPLELAEWPLMVVLSILIAGMADRVSKTAGRYATLYRAASDGLITAHEDERASLARDLHDGVGQILTAVVLTLDAAESAMSPEAEGGSARTLVQRARELAIAALDEAREVAAQLRPARIHELGLGAALRNLAESAGVPVEIRFEASILPPSLIEPQREIDAYRIVQEAVGNATRHAHATHIWIGVEVREGVVTIEVGDDGIGFDKQTVQGRMGLPGMQERTAILMGRLDIRTQPDSGTVVELLIPISQRRTLDLPHGAIHEGAIR